MRETGQELVEFALILPLLLLLFFGIIEVGRLMLSYNTIANGARRRSLRHCGSHQYNWNSGRSAQTDYRGGLPGWHSPAS